MNRTNAVGNDAVGNDTEERPSYAPGEQLPENRLKQSTSPSAGGGHAKSRSGNLLALFVTLLGIGLLAVLVIGCSGGSPAVLILLLGICGFMLLQYFVWGWWLGRFMARREDDRQRG